MNNVIIYTDGSFNSIKKEGSYAYAFKNPLSGNTKYVGYKSDAKIYSSRQIELVSIEKALLDVIKYYSTTTRLLVYNDSTQAVYALENSVIYQELKQQGYRIHGRWLNKKELVDKEKKLHNKVHTLAKQHLRD